MTYTPRGSSNRFGLVGTSSFSSLPDITKSSPRSHRHSTDSPPSKLTQPDSKDEVDEDPDAVTFRLQNRLAILSHTVEGKDVQVDLVKKKVKHLQALHEADRIELNLLKKALADSEIARKQLEDERVELKKKVAEAPAADMSDAYKQMQTDLYVAEMRIEKLSKTFEQQEEGYNSLKRKFSDQSEKLAKVKDAKVMESERADHERNRGDLLETKLLELEDKILRTKSKYAKTLKQAHDILSSGVKGNEVLEESEALRHLLLDKRVDDEAAENAKRKMADETNTGSKEYNQFVSEMKHIREMKEKFEGLWKTQLGENKKLTQDLEEARIIHEELKKKIVDAKNTIDKMSQEKRRTMNANTTARERSNMKEMLLKVEFENRLKDALQEESEREKWRLKAFKEAATIEMEEVKDQHEQEIARLTECIQSLRMKLDEAEGKSESVLHETAKNRVVDMESDADSVFDSDAASTPPFKGYPQKSSQKKKTATNDGTPDAPGGGLGRSDPQKLDLSPNPSILQQALDVMTKPQSKSRSQTYSTPHPPSHNRHSTSSGRRRVTAAGNDSAQQMSQNRGTAVKKQEEQERLAEWEERHVVERYEILQAQANAMCERYSQLNLAFEKTNKALSREQEKVKTVTKLMDAEVSRLSEALKREQGRVIDYQEMLHQARPFTTPKSSVGHRESEIEDTVLKLLHEESKQEEQLTCENCGIRMTSTDILIPCGHTVCTECTTKMEAKGHMQCTQCGPDGRVERTARNRLVNKMCSIGNNRRDLWASLLDLVKIS